MRKIKLHNRDGYSLFLNEIAPCEWLLTSEGKNDGCLYYSVIGDNIAIDPAGGPMIGIGSIIDDEQVTSIEETDKGWIFRTK